MSTDFGHTQWAEEQRTTKALALEVALAAEQIPAGAVRAWDEDSREWRLTLPPRIRRRFEKAAGVRACSVETWLRAAAFLADHEDTTRLETR